MAHPALKRLERAGQRALFGGARLLFSRSGQASAPDWDARPHRVLYLRYDRIGDMIMASGLIRAIAGSHPGITLDVVASPANAPALVGNPHVGEVILFDRRRKSSFPAVLRRLRRGGYDAVIDGMVMTPSATMMLLMLATGARYRIGIGGRRNDFIYTLPVPPAPPDAHLILQAAATALPFGVDVTAADWTPELFMRDAELAAAERRWGSRTAGKARLLLNVSAVTRDRQWPAEWYEAVAREALTLRPGIRLLLISAPHERDLAGRVATAAGGEVAHTPGIRDAFALVATADAVFTPDTSISHAAAALNTPLAVLIPAGSLYGPFGGRNVRIDSDGATLAELPLARAIAGLRALFSLAGI